MTTLKKGSIAVVGADESDLGLVAPNTSPLDLMAQGTMRALDDAGLSLSDVDGLFVSATRMSRSVSAAVLMAFVAASSQELALVPTSSVIR